MPRENNIGQISRDTDGTPYATRPPQRFKEYEKLAVGGTATGLAAVPDSADSVRLRVETADVRWLGHGEDPTTTDGELLKTTDGVLILENLGNAGLRALRFIEAVGAAVLHANYYRVRA
jgi:hypothetical protein